MKISELNLPIYDDEDKDLDLHWDEVDSEFDPEQLDRKKENNVLPEEDPASMTTEPESEDFATNGHRALEQFRKTL